MMANTEAYQEHVQEEVENNSICLKTIFELSKYSFKIPAYQRGFKWTNIEVEALLKDINDFEHKENDDFYCLQPLVVKQQNGNIYNVVDGQQRLTTIFLIWNCLKQDAEKFTIEYETRKGSADFLKKPNEKEKDNNIDNYHIYNAFTTIQIFLIEIRTIKK